MKHRRYRRFKRRVIAPTMDALVVLAGLALLLTLAGFVAGQRVRPARANVEISFSETPVPANMLTAMTIRVTDAGGKPAQNIVPSAGQMVHIFITSDDLVLYGHDHPDAYMALSQNYDESGVFHMPILFPRPGHYALAATLSLDDETTMTRVFQVSVADTNGNVPDRKTSRHKDSRTSKQFDDYLVTLRTNPATLVSCKPARLEYEISQGGESVISQLEPLDSAALAVGAWDEALTSFLFSPARTLPVQTGNVPSQTATADIIFEGPGGYQIFSEFLHHDRVVPASFFVTVTGDPC